MKHKPSRWIGLQASVAYAQLIEDSDQIDKVVVAQFDRPPLLQDRVALTDAERDKFNAAIAIRETTGLPFWECLMLDCFAPSSIPERLLDAVLLHQTNRERNVTFAREAVRQGSLKKIADSVATPQIAALISQLRMTDGSEKHLPMIDFHCPTCIENQKLAISVGRRIMQQPFLLLNSGKSYHAVGTQPISRDELGKTLARAILYSPIVDRGYIAHQLMEGRCALRISKGGHRNVFPEVVDIAA